MFRRTRGFAGSCAGWRFTDDFVIKDTWFKGRATPSVAVVGYEKVRMAAGEFDAFKLKAKGSYSRNWGDGNYTRTYWYAPAARAIVKDEWRTTQHTSQ